MPEVDINYLAVIAVAVMNMIVGSLWYSPLVFGNIWMREAGIKHENSDKAAMQKAMMKSFGLAALGALLFGYVLAHFVDLLSINGAVMALQFAFFTWLGIVAPVQLGDVSWNGKSWTYFLITTSYQLVVLILGALILTYWQ